MQGMDHCRNLSIFLLNQKHLTCRKFWVDVAWVSWGKSKEHGIEELVT